MKKLESAAQTRDKIIRITFAVMMLLALLYFVIGEWKASLSEKADEYQCSVFEADWERVFPDGSREPIEIPGEYDAGEDGRMQLETVLSGVGSHTYLMFWSQRQDIEVYVGDELRRSYTTEESRVFGASSPALFVFIRLEPKDAGKTLTIITKGVPGYIGTGILRTIYCGDRVSIWLEMLRTYGMEVIVGFMVLLIGIASVVFGIVLRLSYRRQNHLEYLGWGVTVASIWIITNSMLRQLLFKNVSVANDLAFIAVMIMPLPFLIYVNYTQQKRYWILYEIAEIIVIINFAVCSFLQVTEICDFPKSFSAIALVCVMAIVFIVGTMIADLVTGHIKEYALSAIGFLGVGVSAVGQIYMYLKETETPFSGSLIAMGLLFLLVISLIDTIRDIMRMEEEKQQAIYASESKARFLAHMSHEIRTPINAILGMDEIILAESGETNILNYAKDIQSAGTTLLSLVNDILDFSKIESGKTELVPTEYEITSLLNDTYHMIVMRAREKRLQLEFECSATLPRRLFGDEVRIRQILVNLLTNAVKYTKEGSVTMRVDWEPWEGRKILLKISVEDTGIGIKEESIDKLFDSFERIDEKKNHNIEGTGLGLNITKRLVELMAGNIRVESEYGKGSTFTVSFPQAVVDSEPVGVRRFGSHETAEAVEGKEERLPVHVEEPGLDFQAPEGRILLVDDVPMNLKVITGLLKSTRVQVDTAESGMECLRKVKETKYHIIFLDHMMPEMDGIETLQQMKLLEGNKNQNTPVIMLTANAIVGAREEYLQEGFSDYLSKPVDSRKLKRIIKSYLPAEAFGNVAGETEAVQKNPTFLERAAFLNTANAMIYSGGSEELYAEIIGMFVEADKQQELCQLFEAEDWKNYQIQVHGLKGTSRSIGADAFSEMAKEVEQAAKNGQIDFVKSHHAELLAEYGRLLEQLRPLVIKKN